MALLQDGAFTKRLEALERETAAMAVQLEQARGEAATAREDAATARADAATARRETAAMAVQLETMTKRCELAERKLAAEVEVERQAGDQRQRAASRSFEKKAKEVVETSLDHLKTDISESVEDTKTGIFNKLA
jgi:hypothetical protein